MFQELGELLSSSGDLGTASRAIGSDDEGTRSALASAVPVLLGSLGKRTNSPGGASALFDLVKGQDGSILTNLGAAFSDSDDSGLNSSFVDGLLGGGKEQVSQGLSQQTGLGTGQIAKLLPMLAPIVLGFLGKKQTDGNLDQAGLVGSLANERVAMESAGFGSLLGLLDSGDAEEDDRGFLGSMGTMTGLGGLAAGTAAASQLTGRAGEGLSGAADGLAGRAGEGLSGSSDGLAAARGGIDGAADKLTGGAAAAAGGVSDGVTGAADKLAGGAAATVGGVAGGVTGAAGGMTDKVTGAAGGAAGKVTGAAGGMTDKVTGAAAGVAGGVTGAAGGMAGKVTGAAKAPSTAVRNTTGAAGAAVATPVMAHDDDRKGGALKWLLPLLLVGVIGVGLWAAFSGGDDEDVAATADNAATTTQLEEMADEVEEMADEVAMTDEDGADHSDGADDAMADDEAMEDDEDAMADGSADGFVAGNILDAGDKDGQVSGFLGAVSATGLNAELDGEGPLTIFAPSDEALASLPESITSDPEKLERVLRNHVVSGDFPADALVDGPLTSLDGSDLNVSLGSGSPVINGANVVTANLGGGNGTMHVIDRVLLPADLISAAGGSLNEALGIQPINFEVGSAVITADSTAVLDGAADFLITNGTVVEIAGHTDADGNDASNLALSQARAESVMAYLTEKGVAAENMTAVGYGETEPIASNDTPEGKAENRRIEFVASAS